MIDVKVKWGGQMLLFTVSDESNIGNLKQEIYEKTKIKPERQKIIGIKAKDDDIVQEMVYLCTSLRNPTEVGALILLMARARMRIFPSLPSRNKAPTSVDGY